MEMGARDATVRQGARKGKIVNGIFLRLNRFTLQLLLFQNSFSLHQKQKYGPFYLNFLL
jgi:hypothetical protein